MTYRGQDSELDRVSPRGDRLVRFAFLLEEDAPGVPGPRKPVVLGERLLERLARPNGPAEIQISDSDVLPGHRIVRPEAQRGIERGQGLGKPASAGVNDAERVPDVGVLAPRGGAEKRECLLRGASFRIKEREAAFEPLVEQVPPARFLQSSNRRGGVPSLRLEQGQVLVSRRHCGAFGNGFPREPLRLRELTGRIEIREVVQLSVESDETLRIILDSVALLALRPAAQIAEAPQLCRCLVRSGRRCADVLLLREEGAQRPDDVALLDHPVPPLLRVGAELVQLGARQIDELVSVFHHADERCPPPLQRCGERLEVAGNAGAIQARKQ